MGISTAGWLFRAPGRVDWSRILSVADTDGSFFTIKGLLFGGLSENELVTQLANIPRLLKGLANVILSLSFFLDEEYNTLCAAPNNSLRSLSFCDQWEGVSVGPSMHG